MHVSILGIARLQRTLREDERGVALPTVMIFMLAGVILSLVVSSTVLYSYTFTSTTRAGVQAQAAAEAGVAAAQAALFSGTCTDTSGVITGTNPQFTAEIWRRADESATWDQACPSILDEVRIESTGYAETRGVNGDSSGDVAVVEAILGNAASPVSVSASGPAIFAYDATGFGGSGSLISLDGGTPDVMLRTGNVTCNGGSSGAVNLVIKSGNFTAAGSCTVSGDVWVNGAANISGGANLHGSVTANSVDSTRPIPGNVWSDGHIRLGWGANVGGWVSGASVEVAGGNIKNAWARNGTTVVSGGGSTGTIYSNGNFTISNGSVANAQVAGSACRTGGNITGTVRATTKLTGSCNHANIQQGAPTLTVSPSKPPAAIVPEWIDFGSLPEHFTAAGWPGYVLYTMPSGVCKEPQFLAALQAIGTNKGLIDARPCIGGIETFSGNASTYYEDSPQNGHHAWRVRNDLTIIANRFQLGNGSFNGVGGIHDLWLIHPDMVANVTPDCANETNSQMRVTGGMKFNDVNVMLYNPCRVILESGVKMRGQIFTHRATIAGDAQLIFVPVGLPGYDLSTGLPLAPAATEWDRAILSFRNITG